MVAAAAGIAAAGSIAGSAISATNQPSGVSSTSSNTPWSEQSRYLTDGFHLAQNTYQNQYQNPVSQYFASTNGMQNAANQGLYNFGMSAPDYYGAWQGVGNTLAGNANSFSSNANALASNGIGTQSSATDLLRQYAQTGQMGGFGTSLNPAIATGLTSTGLSGLGSLGSASSIANQVASTGLNASNGYRTAESAAASAASNPALQAQIAAQQAQVQDSLSTNSLPAIRQAALMSGNANSSREGALEGQAIKGAALANSNIAANLTANAYNTGYQGGLSSYTNGLNSALGAAGTLNSNGGISGSMLGNLYGQQMSNDQFNTNARLSAANNAAQNDLAYQSSNANARLNANAQLGNGLQTGIGATNAYANGVGMGLQSGLNAGNNQQAYDQIPINNQIARNQAAWKNLQDYWGIVANGNFGGGSYTAQQPQQNVIGSALSGAASGGMAGYGMWRNAQGNATNDLMNYSNSLASSGSGFGSMAGWASGQSLGM